MAEQVELESERSRIRNVLVNAGVCSVPQAERRLAESRLHISFAEDAAVSEAGQAALLTAAVTAVRCFGTVTVSGALAGPLLLALPRREGSLAEAVVRLGASIAPNDQSLRNLLIGNYPRRLQGWSVQAWWNGWLAGVEPGSAPQPSGRSECTLAGVTAGALAVGQAFLAEQGDVRAGRSPQRISLWSPDVTSLDDPGPPLTSCAFPLELWLVGLGNLGQAYMWSLSMLPFRRREQVLLFLQDDDVLRKENWGTSVLAERARWGALKTRIAEDWAERTGFRVRRIDRRLDQYLRRTDQEPGMALVGLDRMEPRRLLGRSGFKYIVDGGLGATVDDYRKIRVSAFGPGDDPGLRFEGLEDQNAEVVAALLRLPAYQEIQQMPEGACGAATLAGLAVAVPFVSAVAGALVLAQATRIATGKGYCPSLTADVGDVRTLRASAEQPVPRLELKTDAPEA